MARDFTHARHFPVLPARLKAKLPGRLKLPDAIVATSVRMDSEMLARWKASGAGWQTRMAAVLAECAPRALKAKYRDEA